MASLRFIILTIFILSLGACGDTPAKLAPDKDSPIAMGDTLVLLYQKEQKGEVWVSGSSVNSLLDSFTWKGKYPLGELFSFADGDLLRKFQGKRTIVLPHAPMTDGKLGPCFACRHDEIEVYASLNLILRELGIQRR